MVDIEYNINYDLKIKETISDKIGILRIVFLLIEKIITLIIHNTAAIYNTTSLNDKVILLWYIKYNILKNIKYCNIILIQNFCHCAYCNFLACNTVS